MKAEILIRYIKTLGIETIAGVPDSTLRYFCDYVNGGSSGLRHFTTADEGAALSLGIGEYLATKKPICVYMQNSGIGNIVNPLTSLVHDKVYRIPVFFVIGWRGEPEKKDEPQHKFMGEITLQILNLLNVDYAVVDGKTTKLELDDIFLRAGQNMSKEHPFALVVKSGTFEKNSCSIYHNSNELIREDVVRYLLEHISQKSLVISTTGKISRELYENMDLMYGNHRNLFMCVGGMGYANMIASGIAECVTEKKVYCIDGDGALLMHMGNMAFIGKGKKENYIHICLNNEAHESVGGMPTVNSKVDFSEIAKSCGYQYVVRVANMKELQRELECISSKIGPIFLEIMVQIGSRENLIRPQESALENKKIFMDNIDC